MLKNKNLKFYLFAILIIFCLTYREFLETLKFFLFHKYNFSMLPLDPYYNQILYYSNLINDNIGWPWNMRYIPNYFNYLIFEILPCLKVREIPEFLSNNEYCAMWSISIANYLSTIFSALFMFFYSNNFLKLKIEESILIVFVTIFYFSFLDRFGIDRFSLFYLLLIFYFSLDFKHKYILISLTIILSIFVNEKITIFLFLYYVSQELYLNKGIINFNLIKKILLSYKIIISGLMILYYIITSLFLNSEFVFDNNVGIKGTNFNYLSFHSLSNTLIPLLLISMSYFYLSNKKNLLNKIRVNKYNFYFILPIFIIIGILIGGPGNTGRYLVYFSPISILLINKCMITLIYNFYKKN
jgi:hypothetical protein